MSKPHYRPTTKQLALNSVMRRLPFYNQGMSAHLFGTKHSKSYGEYGWPLQMDFWYYKHVYDRVGLARAVVNLPVSLCWLTHPMIKDAKTEEENEQFKEFAERTGYWRSCKDADRTQRVGHYGGMIVFVRDGNPLSAPLEANSINLDDIVEFMPFWEGQLIPGTIDSNQQSPRYGLPIEYTYNNRGVFKPNQRDGGDSFTVHHTRVRIRNEGAIGRTIYGESSIEPVFNAIIDWEKKRGAGGEGAWRICAARPILKALAETAGQGPSDAEMETLIEAIGDMHTSFDSVPVLGGYDVTTLNQDLPDLKDYFAADISEIAAGSGISQAGLIGNQTGKLAGDKDSSHDKEMAQSRREGYLSEEIKLDLKWLGQICRDFDDRGLIVEWTDLSEPSDQVRLENIAKMADINYKTWQATGSIAFSIDEMREKAMYLPLEAVEELAFTEGETVPVTNAKTFSPPEGVQKAAKQGLEYRDKYGRGGTAVGIARARDLSNGANISESTINRMVSFFARHAENRNPDKKEPDGGPTNGWIAWLLWGGDAGRDWANKISDQLERDE